MKLKNTIAAELLTCKQLTGESIGNFVVGLKRLIQECECEAVSAERYCLELISQVASHRLLEKSALSFEDAFEKVRAMKLAYKSSGAYQGTTSCSAGLVETQAQREDGVQDMDDANNLRTSWLS